MRSVALPGSAGSQLSCTAAPAPAQRAAIEQVYEDHFDFVWRTARRLGTPDLYIDDVVQEVFVVVQRRLADFEGRAQLKTWLFGITRRVVLAHGRRHGRRQRVSIDDVGEVADTVTPSAESQLVSDEDTRLLYTLLDQLDPDKREVFVLSELEEMSGPAIAEALDLQLSNVYARIRVARLAFEAALHRHRLRARAR